MVTLGVDYGASSVGLALVRTDEKGRNIPLFAGTIRLDARWLKEKVETRAGIRRLRRTRKTKRHRLRQLEQSLAQIGLSAEQIQPIVRFSNRRGYKSLFDNGVADDDHDEAELTYRFTREEFFKALSIELQSLIPDLIQRQKALSACEVILNRQGLPSREIRQIKIDNRGASRCAWEGCNRVTPRSDNALEEVLSQQLYTVFQSALKGNPILCQKVETATHELHELAKRLRNAAGEAASGEKKILRKRARTILRALRELLYTPADGVGDGDKAWKYIETGMMNIMETRLGRNRYCREHSREYIQTICSGKPVPFKQTISDSDIISRREQIAYAKLWRYIEARILPLAPPGGIDRVVVERTAFDLLAGSWKTIQGATDQFKEEMYQHGPMYGFESVPDMLKEEFGGLCAYCGQSSNTLIDVDHILPHADFLFDSYLNILPACPKCNSDLKRDRSISDLSLAIHPDAYKAYSDYLKKKFSTRPMHFFHSIKKGVLNLMQDVNRLWEAERYLSLIARQFAQIVQSQRGPRPFARYLSTKLALNQGEAPKIRFRNGRHTALYRRVAYPDFQKQAEKKEGNVLNHALDAILLASELPDLYPVESLNIPLARLKGWVNTVRSRAPKSGDEGIPVCPGGPQYVDGFETVHPGGYVEVELRSMRWNQKDSMTHKQDPYGFSEKTGMPTKRGSAFDLYTELKKEKNSSKVKSRIVLIHHPALRKILSENLQSDTPGPSAAEALKAWLRISVRNSLAHSRFSNHPGDQARRSELEKFATQEDCPIPTVIGAKMSSMGVRGKIDLRRLDRQTGGIGHRYMTQPPNKGVIVDYPKREDGKPDLTRPCRVYHKQDLSMAPENMSIFKAPPPILSDGVILGEKPDDNGNRRRALEKYLSDCGFHSYIYLTPGCTIRYKDGTEWFVRNFDTDEDFKKGRLKEIIGTRRTPFIDSLTQLKTLSQ
jgi:hypothetical protein